MQDAVTRTRQICDRVGKIGATFLVTDVELAMTLTRIASHAPEGSGKKCRNQANARHAYDEISRISSHAVLTANERQDVNHKLAELRSSLEQLGEAFG